MFFRVCWVPGSGGRSLTRSHSLLCSVVQHLVNLLVPTKLQRFCPGIRVDKEGTAKASDLLCLVLGRERNANVILVAVSARPLASM